MKYRLLDKGEWHRLESIVNKERIPNPLVSRAAVAETEDGHIAGCLFLQLAAHVEPLFIEKEFTHAVRFDKLLKTVRTGIEDKPFYCFSESKVIEKMLKHIGAENIDCKVWLKK